VGDCERSLSVLPTLNADSFAISAFFFAFLGLKCPFLTHFLLFFVFFANNLPYCQRINISSKMSNRAKVGMFVQRLILEKKPLGMLE